VTIYEKLMFAQSEMKVPKSNYNSFGKYSYRNCEDILEAFKPIGKTIKALMIINDELVLIGERYYIKATATFIDTETAEKISNDGFAREEDNKKGMDGSQVTGATSSYARKYALNGLFCIDDTKDSDCTNVGEKSDNVQSNKEQSNKQQSKPKSPGERDKLVEEFEAEIIRTGKSKKWFLEQAKASDVKWIKSDKLKEFITGLKALPSKVV